MSQVAIELGILVIHALPRSVLHARAARYPIMFTIQR